MLKNSYKDYGAIAIFLHWLMAILVIALIIIGFYMTNIPISLRKLRLYGWHKEYGLLALLLVSVRLIWRSANILPHLQFLPVWERAAALTVHRLFFVFLFLLPLTGWLMTSAAGLPVAFFGLFVWPNLTAANSHYFDIYRQLHRWLGYGLLGLLTLHVLAALKHHFINKDEILKRMLF